MIVGSVDVQGGEAVQLVGGETLAENGGDPRRWTKLFGRVGEVAIVDLDAAMGEGENTDVIRELLPLARCRVGGGIRSVEQALDWLSAGADSVVLGTAATPEILSRLPRERVYAALDARNGEVVVEGWKTSTGATIEERLDDLLPYVAGFLVTFVEREGRMKGIDMARVRDLAGLVGDRRLIVAGGVTTPDEVAELDALGVDCQVGMALYTGRLDIGEAFAACLKSDRPDGLVPTVVTSPIGYSLGLVYSSTKSIQTAVSCGEGVYWSRRRGLWRKGATSGATQDLLRIEADCDRDSIRFVVRQKDGFCHTGEGTCWGAPDGLVALQQTIQGRAEDRSEGSYTASLFSDDGTLGSKLREEADELAVSNTKPDVVWEAADLFYFTMVKMAKYGVTLEDVGRELDRRSGAVRRRSEKEAT